MANGEKNSAAGILTDTAVVTALVACLLYTAGWAFAYGYFAKFHLGLLSLDIPVEYFFIYGFWVLEDNFWPFFILLVYFLLISATIIFLIRRDKGPDSDCRGLDKPMLCFAKPVLIGCAPLLLIFFFKIVYDLGKDTAVERYERQMKNDFDYYPRVQIWMKDDKGAGKKRVGEMKHKRLAWQKGCYRLLLQSKGHIYIFHTAGTFRARMPTDSIPTGEIKAMRILAPYKSCGPDD